MDSTAQFLKDSTDRLREYSLQVDASYSPLSDFQFNWRPDPKTWSVGLVLDHIITTNRTYFPVFRQIADGEYKMKFWTRISPLSGPLGRNMVKTLGPNPTKTYTSPPAFRPTRSKVSGKVIARFQEMQEELTELLQGMGEYDLKKLRIPSPASSFFTYSVHHAIRIIDVHEARHLQQADRLMARDEFPK